MVRIGLHLLEFRRVIRYLKYINSEGSSERGCREPATDSKTMDHWFRARAPA